MVTTEFTKLRASIGDSGGWISSVVLHKNNTLTICCSVSFFTTKIFQIPAFWCPKMLFMCQKKAKTVKQTLFSKISRYTLTVENYFTNVKTVPINGFVNQN